MSDEECMAVARGTAKNSVVEETDTKYRNQIWTMQKWLDDRKPRALVMGDKQFAMFLASHNGGIKNWNSARHWFSAWKYWLVLEGINIPLDPANEALVKRQIAGLRYKGGKPEDNSADAIDSGRLHDLVTFLFMTGQSLYALGFLLFWYIEFRKDVFVHQLKVKDVRFNTDLGTLIYSKRMKAATAKKMGPGLMGNFKEVDNLTKLLKTLTEGRKPDEKLFEGWNDKKASEILKKFAKDNGWGEGKWVMNSLRHGSSREAFAVLADEPTVIEVEQTRTTRKVMKRMGHTNPLSQRTYQLSHSKKAKK